MGGYGIDQCLEEMLPPLKKIVTKLVECLKENLILFQIHFFTTIALLLDTVWYKNKTPNEIYNAATIVVEQFDDLLMANGFRLECLSTLKQETFVTSIFRSFMFSSEICKIKIPIKMSK